MYVDRQCYVSMFVSLSPIVCTVDDASVVEVSTFCLVGSFQAVGEYRHCPETMNALDTVYRGGLLLSYITINCLGYRLVL